MADKPRLRFRVKKPPVEEPAEVPGYSSHAMVAPPPQPKGPAMIDVPVHQILAAIEGRTQGAFASEGKGFRDCPGTAHKHQFAIEEIDFPMSVPSELSTGSPSGRHVFGPFTLQKANDASTPQFYQAMVTSETLDTAIFDCYGTDKAGAMVLAATVKLTGALVSSVDFAMPDIRATRDGAVHQTIQLVFQHVDMTFVSGEFSGAW